MDIQKKFKAGDVIITQGEPGDSAYIIEEGKVEITIRQKDGEILNVGTRSVGAMIGEMSIIDNAPRTATITALEDCSLLEITKEDFTRRLDQADPVIRMASRVIITRYRDMVTRSAIQHDNALWPPAELVELEYTGESDALDAIRLASEFQKGLTNGEICLHYQPILDLKEENIIGFEALMRWFHPERGFISPGIFIPIIEQSDLMIEASKWALKESCSALKRIEGATGYDSHLHMSVNFSSTDFSSDDFVENVYNTLSETDIKPEQLHLEITERLLMNQPENAKDTLNMCKKAGMQISIDDFGTGYSSLSYLHFFPIDILKIDQSFIRDMHEKEQSLALVKSIISLGKNLKMSIVAEGVECQEEADLLKEMGCDYVQGYFYAKPMAEKDVIALIHERIKN